MVSQALGRYHRRNLITILKYAAITSFVFLPALNIYILKRYKDDYAEEHSLKSFDLIADIEDLEINSEPYSYSFVIGGLHEDRLAYKGFIYNILISVSILKRLGSSADFIVWAQLSSDSKMKELPSEDMRLFNALDIQVIMIEKSKHDSFATLLFDKFQALKLTQYRRVMYLDSDILPLVNLDYLFRLSDPADATLPNILQPNFIIASMGAPCDGGMIMMEPTEGAWEKFRKVMQRQRKEGVDFDVQKGWGHNFLESGDWWESMRSNGTDWNFDGGKFDEGLWYYFAKYLRKDVSIIIADRLQNWKTDDESGMPIKVTDQRGILERYSSKPIAYQNLCDVDLYANGYPKHLCLVPYRDFAHFNGRDKPWQVGVEKVWFKGTRAVGNHAPHRLWFSELDELNKKYLMGLDIRNWDRKHLGTMEESPLGYGPAESAEISDTGLVALEELPPETYAYSFVIGGFHEDRKAYKGFLYNVLVTVNILKRLGSMADFIVWAQLSPDSTKEELPSEDMRLLRALGIKVMMMEKPTEESFAHLMYDKFRALQLTQYRRIIYLDSDIIPLVNLDYLFRLSDPEEKSSPTILQPSIILSSRNAPCNGGMFMMHPTEDSWENLSEVIRRQREDGRSLPYPHFDIFRGWGHRHNSADPEDVWESVMRNGTSWKFHGAHSDQGLWYHYAKYVDKNVTIIIGNRVQKWMAIGENKMPIKVNEEHRILEQYSPESLVYQDDCNLNFEDSKFVCFVPYRDLAHFTGKSKPWQVGVNKVWMGGTGNTGLHAPHRLWFQELGALNEEYGLGLDIRKWNEKHMSSMVDSPLGYMPLHKDNAKMIFANNNNSNIPASKKITDTLSSDKILNSIKESPVGPYAYSFIIGGFHENRTAYKGFLYNILISVNILKRLGSKADFIVWTQLSPDDELNALPSEDMRLLKALGIKVIMMEKPTEESFAHLMYDKLQALQLTQYRRIIYLDSDIIPLVNLDYLFLLSDPIDKTVPTLIQPNLIIANRITPCDGSMLMMQPAKSAWEQLLEVAKRHSDFDEKNGWGHNFLESGDMWEAVIKNGTNWKFDGAYSDQGLWYYFAKYIRKDVSIIIGDRLQNWISNGKADMPIKVTDQKGLLENYSSEPIEYQDFCDTDDTEHGHQKHVCVAPYQDLAHFKGDLKPWRVGMEKSWYGGIGNGGLHAPHRLWFKELFKLNDDYDMGLDIRHLDKHVGPEGDLPRGDLILSKSNHSSNGLFSYQNPTISDKKVKKKVAYAISLIRCESKLNADIIDASLVLQHSIHMISSRNPESGSKYDYKMYAIVHRQAEACSDTFKKIGFEVLIVDPPVTQREIRGEFLRQNIEKELYGSDEFINLYAYTLPEEVIVFVSLNFAFFKPIDHLFDAILYESYSYRGQAARRVIELERSTDKIPDNITAFITRDWSQVVPNKYIPGYQAGFLVARRDPSIVEEMVEIVKEGNYIHGWGSGYGWGKKGYGGYLGAMTMQGLVAYFYDHIRPNSAVELNQCRYNHVGVDVFYRSPPHFQKDAPGAGGCRNGLPSCEDCMLTTIDTIYNAQYTACKKPWQCVATGSDRGERTKMNTASVSLTHCHLLVKKWHIIRENLEAEMYKITSDISIKNGSVGTYMPSIFQGHCSGNGDEHYLQISGTEETFNRVQELY